MKTYLLACALTALTLPAHAATYGYSFSNVYGAVAGDVSGTITLADGDGTFAATSVTIDSFPVALNLGSTPITNFIGSFENTFTVIGGNIDSAAFFGLIDSSTALSISSMGASGISFLDEMGGNDFGESGVQDAFSSTLTFTAPAAATVPLPAGIFLLGGALFGLGAVRRKAG